MNERTITKQEERAFRLCHHDFGGLDVASAAAKMRVSPRKIKALLKSVECKAPQLFPILTERQKAVITLHERGASRKVISQALGVTLGLLNREVSFLRKRGFIADKHVVRYEPSMDHLVKEKF